MRRERLSDHHFPGAGDRELALVFNVQVSAFAAKRLRETASAQTAPRADGELAGYPEGSGACFSYFFVTARSRHSWRELSRK